MSVFLSTRPNVVDFAGNAGDMLLVGSDYVIEAGAAQETELDISNFPNFAIEIHETGNDEIWQIYAGTPIAGTYAHTVQVTNTATIDTILDRIQKYAPINEEYGWTKVDATTIKVARKENSEFGVVVLTNVNVGVNETTAPLAPDYRDNYKIFARMATANSVQSVEYIEVPGTETYLDVNINAETKYKLDTFIKSLFNHAIPTVAQNTMQRDDGAIIKYIVKAAEHFGNPAKTGYYSIASARYMVDGKLPFTEHSQHDEFNDIKAALGYLTRQPNQVETTEAQPQYLYFMMQEISTTNIEVDIELFYTDATTSLQTALLTYNNAERYEVFNIPVGVQALGLNAVQPAKTLLKYTVTVNNDSATILAAARTYILKQTSYNTRYFLYLNKEFGAWETLRTEGESTFSKNVKTQQYNHPLEMNYDTIKGDAVTTLEQEQTEYEVWTGFKLKAETRYYAKALESALYFFVMNYVEQTWEKVDLMDNKVDITESNGLHSFAIKYRKAS